MESGSEEQRDLVSRGLCSPILSEAMESASQEDSFQRSREFPLSPPIRPPSRVTRIQGHFQSHVWTMEKRLSVVKE